MATKVLYFKNAVPTGATAHRSLQEAGSVTAATTTTGWVAGTNVLGQSCIQNGGTEIGRNDAQWSATLRPDGTALSQTLGDGWRSELPFDGTFANTNWSFTFGFRSVTAAYTGRLKLAVRVWKSNNPNGVGATELTGSRVASAATAANLSTTVDTTLTWTWTPGAARTLRGEYLFVQVGLEVTTAGGGTTQDFDFRVDSASGYAVTTPDFVPAPPGAFEEDVNTPTGAVLRKLALGFVFVGSSLLTTTLGPVVAVDAPIGSQSIVQAPEYRKYNINDDTSYGTPKPLIPDATQLRAAVLSHRYFKLAINADGSRGFTPPIVAIEAPVGADQTQTAPDGVRPVVDTTRGTPKTLTEDLSAPVGAEQTYTPPDVVRPVTDTTRGTPKPLTDDAQLPVGTQTPGGAPERPRGFSAWQAQQPIELQAIVAAAAPFVPSSFARAPERPAIAPPVSVRNIAAAVAATVPTRPPLLPLQQARQINTETSRGFVPPVVAVVAPVGASQYASAPARILGVADTSKGTPKVLIADAQAPVGTGQTHTAPDRVRPVTDTTRGTGKTLTQDAQAPVGSDQTHTAPDRIRPVVDTSAGTPKPLRIEPTPPGIAGWSSPTDAVRRVWDTTRGTPKTLIEDAQAPIFVPAHFAPSIKSIRGWLPADTSARQPITLQVVIQAPPAGLVAPNFGPLRPWFQPVDSTRGTPKTLIRDAQAPVFDSPVFAPVAKPIAGWLPADTSHGTPKTLTADRQLPFFVAAHFAPSIQSIRGWLPADTSFRVPAPLQFVAPPAPAGTVTPHFSPMRASFQPEDGTSGTPPPLLVVTGAPKIIAEAFTTMHLSNLGSGMGQQ